MSCCGAVAGSQSQRAGSISSPSEPSPNKDLNFDSGRAEACGAIARLMCSKKTGEVIQPVYLARCYMAMYQALSLVYVSMSSRAILPIRNQLVCVPAV